QAPHLTGGNIEPVVKLGAGPQLALAEHVAVALPVVRSGAGTEEVRFVVAGDLGAADLRLREQRRARLPRRAVILRRFVQRIVRIGNSGDWGGDVAAGGAAEEHCFGRDESARRNVDALELDRGWPVFGRLLRVGLLTGHRRLQNLVAGLEV